MLNNEKDAIQKMCELCETLAEKTGLYENLEQEKKLSEVLKIELIFFLSYLTASDGVISWNESRYIGDLFDVNLTPEKINSLIIDQDLYSERFENSVPVVMQLFVAIDNALYENGVEIDEELGNGLIMLYTMLAKGLVESNGRTAETMEEGEQNDLNIFLSMLKRYIDDNTRKHHVDLMTNYSKRKKDGSGTWTWIPEDKPEENHSVKAPKKKR